MSAILFNAKIGPVAIDAFISENHKTEISITANPIETGAEVNDHAYVEPKHVTIEAVDSSAAGTFQSLVRFQESRVPFSLVTGLAVYKNMLVKSINAERDKTHSRIFKATIHLQEVIIVGTAGVGLGFSLFGGGSFSSFVPGLPGGANSVRAAALSATRSIGRATQDRASSPVQRGDARAVAVPADYANTLLEHVFK